jgi:Replication protein
VSVAGPPALENIANKVSPPSRRTARFALRALLWDVSSLPRLRHCGRSRTGDFVGVRHSHQGSGFAGLQSCGSVWACPVDSAKIAARRSLEIGAGLLTWQTRDSGRLVFVTLTLRHHAATPLAESWDALLKAWKMAQSGKQWRTWRDRLGSPGMVRVTEVTTGGNGWHVHLHAVMCVGSDVTSDRVAEFEGWLVPKWARCLEAVGASALPVGQKVYLVDGVKAVDALGEYLAKSTAYGAAESLAAESLGRELTGGLTKTARGAYGTDPVWQLAEVFKQTGDLDLLDRWRQYERGSKGRRQIGWSRGLRDLLSVGRESTDEEVASEVVGDQDLVRITADGWTHMLRTGRPLNEILDAVEVGTDSLKQYLDTLGVEFYTPEVGK